MNELALQLMDKCLETKAISLDLGNCGLKDEDFTAGSPVDQALRQCTHLEELTFSTEWANPGRRDVLQSLNKGEQNFFTRLPAGLAALTKLKKLIFAGDEKEEWLVPEIGAVSSLVGLQYLDLSNNQLTGLKEMESLTAL